MTQRWAACVLGAVLLLRAAPSTAQPSPSSIPRFAVDLQGTSTGLPTAEGWIPPIPVDTKVPSRGLGVQGGAHVYLGRFGVGATFMFGEGRTKPIVGGTPPMSSRVQAFAPQASLNFGHGLGWSYLSAGYGAVQVDSKTEALPGLPAATVESGWVPALNFGGGARWFIRDHFGVGFDVRWHKLSSPDVSGTPAPRTTLFTLGVGLTFQ